MALFAEDAQQLLVRNTSLHVVGLSADGHAQIFEFCNIIDFPDRFSSNIRMIFLGGFEVVELTTDSFLYQRRLQFIIASDDSQTVSGKKPLD